MYFVSACILWIRQSNLAVFEFVSLIKYSPDTDGDLIKLESGESNFASHSETKISCVTSLFTPRTETKLVLSWILSGFNINYTNSTFGYSINQPSTGYHNDFGIFCMIFNPIAVTSILDTTENF